MYTLWTSSVSNQKCTKYLKKYGTIIMMSQSYTVDLVNLVIIYVNLKRHIKESISSLATT